MRNLFFIGAGEIKIFTVQCQIERSLTANSFDSYALIIRCEDFSGILMALINAKKSCLVVDDGMCFCCTSDDKKLVSQLQNYHFTQFKTSSVTIFIESDTVTQSASSKT